MTESTYSVIFRGDLEPGYTAADVKANMARLFKAGPETVDKLFSGRPLAIKKGLNLAQAEQLQATLARQGAQSSVKNEAAPEAEAVPAPRPMEETPAAPAPVAKSAPVAQAEGALSLAPMEGNLLKEHERTTVEPVQVPVSHLSLKPAVGNLVEASEQQAPPPVQVKVPDWKLGGHVTGKASFKLPD
ncbi:hypothetical protein KUV95_13505 [Microbulbifer agarilyticus]|uniref:hypothetical protein n=1 Tax=Microbulbifer agarilyticus TaxID=260552 RepID=UPI001C958FC8|nr:hypothetical protein [Microbulbifer agarilyticus]MBY6212568.1 hypothetical protein [Microbulbifer agarilyticus]